MLCGITMDRCVRFFKGVESMYCFHVHFPLQILLKQLKSMGKSILILNVHYSQRMPCIQTKFG